jgi:hypothetical protein
MIIVKYKHRLGETTVNWAAAAAVLGLTTSACAAPEPGAAVVNGTRSAGGATQPTVLADSELDSVTAAGVLVDAGSFAAALGDFGHTLTDANTFVFGGEHLDLGVGTTTGQAFACCGEDADVEVGSAVLGIGDIVHGVAHGIEHDRGLLAYGFSWGLVVAVSFEKRLAMIEELRLALADLYFAHTDALSSDAGSHMVGAE